MEQGHAVTGVFLRSGIEPGPRAAAGKQGCCSARDAQDAARVADLLEIPFYSLDFAAEFDGLIDGFAAEYARGRTPNPCIACNRDLKFGRLLQFADALGADRVATGHYAATEPHAGRVALRMPRDAAKDQTYVLFPLSQAQLSRTLFPLAERTKGDVRSAASERGLPVAEKPESMEICFVPGGDYRAVLAERAPGALVPGPIVDEASGEVVGTHPGVGAVTIGQRKGLGLGGGPARYVTRVDPAANRVLVGDRSGLLRREVEVSGWNAVAAPVPDPGQRLRGAARVRRNHRPTAASAERLPGDDRRLRVVFDEPVGAPAPGQALVLYDEAGRVLGGGWIAASR
jgi:tRNA-specific 2-thiouridylase